MSNDETRARQAMSLVGATEVSRRDDRWLALGSDLVAFTAFDATGWRRLEVEGRLLARWRAAGIPAPQIMREDTTSGIQLRERMHGLTGEVVEPLLFGGPPPEARIRLSDAAPISAFGLRLAESYGELAARIRHAVPVADAAALGLGHRVDDHFASAFSSLHALAARADNTTDAETARRPTIPRELVTAAEQARSWIESRSADTAAIHGDLHFHNMCLADDGSIIGVFDVGDSGIDEAATEMQYAHSLGPRFAATALAAYAYEQRCRGEHPLDEVDVCRAHLRTALGHLFWHGPGKPRHASVVGWVTAALERVLPLRNRST